MIHGSAENEAWWILVMFGSYIVWDVLSKWGQWAVLAQRIWGAVLCAGIAGWMFAEFKDLRGAAPAGSNPCLPARARRQFQLSTDREHGDVREVSALSVYSYKLVLEVWMRLAVALFIGAAQLCGLAFAQPAFVLDANGRTVRAASQVSSRRSFQIRMPAPVAFPLCGNPKLWAPGMLQLKYEELDRVADPHVITGGTTITPVDDIFTIKPSKAGFLVYNIHQTAVGSNDALQECMDLIEKWTAKETELKTKIERMEYQIPVAETKHVRLSELLKSQQQDTASYAGIAGAATDIAALLAKIEKTRKEVVAAAAELDKLRDDLRQLRDELEGLPQASEKDLNASADRAKYLLDSLTKGAILKIGAVFVGGGREAVFYDFSARSADSTLQLQPLGDYPTLTHEETVFAVLANVDTKRHPYGFRLSAGVSAGSAINTEPVRPTFPVLGESAALVFRSGAAPPDNPVSEHALRDVILPVRDNIPPNGVVEVTIATERPTAADPKKLETVTLVDKVKLPQFRARYRYSITTGIFRSTLRDTTFTKVKTHDDDPATTPANEAAYRIDSRLNDAAIRPVFALAYYLAPLDIQSKVGWREIIPAPTIGFSFQNPQDNIYAGFTHEFLRNLQVFWGWHFGTTTEMVNRNDVSEEKDSTAVVTRQRRSSKGNFAVGVTFNVAVIAKVFK